MTNVCVSVIYYLNVTFNETQIIDTNITIIDDPLSVAKLLHHTTYAFSGINYVNNH